MCAGKINRGNYYCKISWTVHPYYPVKVFTFLCSSNRPFTCSSHWLLHRKCVFRKMMKAYLAISKSKIIYLISYTWFPAKITCWRFLSLQFYPTVFPFWFVVMYGIRNSSQKWEEMIQNIRLQIFFNFNLAWSTNTAQFLCANIQTTHPNFLFLHWGIADPKLINRIFFLKRTIISCAI